MRGQVELRISEQGNGRRLEVDTQARFFGASVARSTSVSLLDGASGQARSYRTESKKRSRRYTFAPEGYTVEKFKRAKDDHPWESASTHTYAYPLAEDGVTILPVYDYYGMILRLKAEPLRKIGDEVTVHVATSSGPEAYTVRVSEIRVGSRTIRRPRETARIELAAQEMRLSVTPTASESESGFLDMEGEVEIWVEAETKTLIEIVGDVPKIPGKVHLVLDELG